MASQGNVHKKPPFPADANRLVLPDVGTLGKQPRVWVEADVKAIRKPGEVDAIEGLFLLDKLVRQLDASMPLDWTIYLRIFGGPLTAKTDLMMFLRENGVGGINPDRINGVETDKLLESRSGWGSTGWWDKDTIVRERPDMISDISKGRRLVVLEGVYSSLLHPSGKWWFGREGDMSPYYAMDVELETVASTDVSMKRAIRRDKNPIKLYGWGNVSETWTFPINGKDLVFSTDLAEDTGALEKKISALEQQMPKDRIQYLKKYLEFSIGMKEFYEKT